MGGSLDVQPAAAAAAAGGATFSFTLPLSEGRA